MKKRYNRFHVGLRTIKTAVAVIIAMVIVEFYGATTSKLVFAMLGAMAAVQPTFKESLESCLSQLAGTVFGAVAGVFLLSLPISHFAATGIGIVLVLGMYNALGHRFAPSLACLMVVTLCTTPDILPLTYATGRLWDSAIGLGVGMLINTLVFPYDNSRQIRTTVESLDRELILFLENMFDGDEVLPDVDDMSDKVDDMARQLGIFARQRWLIHPQRQRRKLEAFRRCEGKARQLVAHMEVLYRMDRPGRLSPENRELLDASGAKIRDPRMLDTASELDVVTNYHVGQILILRRELLDALAMKE
ncbi:MAG: FUSC family protein [Oscillospiraceae bacterium]|nr:FUSC family protein [Oscillospiraceae bacterium]